MIYFNGSLSNTYKKQARTKTSKEMKDFNRRLATLPNGSQRTRLTKNLLSCAILEHMWNIYKNRHLLGPSRKSQKFQHIFIT